MENENKNIFQKLSTYFIFALVLLIPLIFLGIKPLTTNRVDVDIYPRMEKNFNETSIDINFIHQLNKIKKQKSQITNYFSNTSKELGEILLKKLDAKKAYDFAYIYQIIEKNIIDNIHLKMRLDLNVLQPLKDFYQIHRIKDQKMIEFLNKIGPKELIICLVENLNRTKKSKFGERIIEAGYPIPLFYRSNNQNYVFNSELFQRSFLVSSKPLISIFSTNSISAEEFKLFNLYTFFLGDRIKKYNSINRFLDNYSIDIYRELFYSNTSEKQRNNEFMLATINGFNGNKKYLSGFLTIINFSAANLFHITIDDINDYYNLNAKSQIEFIFEIFEQIVIENRSYFIILIKVNKNVKNNDILIKFDKDVKKRFPFLYVGYIKYREFSKDILDNGKNSKWLDMNKKLVLKLEPFLNKKEFYLADSDFIINFYEKQLNYEKTQKNFITMDHYYQLLKDVQDFSKLPKKVDKYLSHRTELKKKLFHFNEIRKNIDNEKNKLESLKKETEKNINSEKLMKEYQETQQKIQDLRKNAEKTELNPIVQEFSMTFFEDNYNYMKASVAISEWITPILKFLTEQKTKKINKNLNSDLLVSEINDKDISIETFLTEILNGINLNNEKVGSYENVGDFIKKQILSEEPINLINEDLHFGGKILKNILNKLHLQGEINIISILGPQSSGKSTLLNYLFGAGFKVASGRCTKGVYFTLLTNVLENRHLIIIDTEGLMTTSKGRDHLFDNQIATLIFSISNIVILNHKGELDRNMKQLLEVSNYALKALDLKGKFKPYIFLVMHGMVDRNRLDEESQKTKIIQELKDLNPELKEENHLVFKNEYIFLFSPPFGEENLFDEIDLFQLYDKYGKKCIKLKNKLFSCLSKHNSYYGIIEFYEKAKQNWKIIKKYGSSLMRAKSLLQRKALESGLEITRQISKDLRDKSQKLHNFLDLISNYKDPKFLIDKEIFDIKLNDLFNDLKQDSRNTLEETLTEKNLMKFLDDDNMQELYKRLEFDWNMVKKELTTLYLENYYYYERIEETSKFLKEMQEILNNFQSQNKDKIIKDYKAKYNQYIKKEEEKKKNLKETTKVAVVRKFKEIFYSIKEKTDLNENILQDYLDLDDQKKSAVNIKTIINEWINCINKCTDKESQHLQEYYKDFINKMKEDIKSDCNSDSKIKEILLKVNSHFKDFKNPFIISLTPEYKHNLLNEIVLNYYLCQFQQNLYEINKNIKKIQKEMEETLDTIDRYAESKDQSGRLGIAFAKIIIRILTDEFNIDKTKEISNSVFEHMKFKYESPEKVINSLYKDTFETEVRNKTHFYKVLDYLYNLNEVLVNKYLTEAREVAKNNIQSKMIENKKEFNLKLDKFLKKIDDILNGKTEKKLIILSE